MFPFKHFLILVLVFISGLAESQTLRRKGLRKSRVEAPHFRISFALETWQEAMTLKNAGNEANMRAQSDGLAIDGVWVESFGRWERYYGGEFALGRVKGKGSTAAVPDELNDQPWYLLGAIGGYAYRTSPVGKLGFSASIAYRRIQWKLASDAELDIESKPFALGLGLQYGITMSRRSSIVVAATHQYFWSSTVWSIGYQANFL